MNFKNFRLRNVILTTLMVFLFVEVLIIFPNRLEKNPEPEAERRTTLSKDVLQDSDTPSNEDTGGGIKAEQRMKGVHLVESQQGKRDWELFSESATGSQGKGTWNLKQVRVLFYNMEKIEYTVTGDEGAIDSKTKDLRIRGHVVTKSANGYIFETPSIFYSAYDRRIESPEQVVMRGPRDGNGEGLHLRGSDMLVHVDQSRMLIRGKVTAEKELKDQKKLLVEADSAEFSGKNREARFIGKVSLTYNKMKIEGPEAVFGYSKNADILSTVQVLGGVKVSDVDKFASSDRLDVDVLQNILTFRGKPKIIQNDDELTGDEITFLDGGKRVKVNRVKARVER
jgi:LPS export ABC transporter protein LptC/lipopolysaccharide transport protein LptA